MDIQDLTRRRRSEQSVEAILHSLADSARKLLAHIADTRLSAAIGPKAAPEELLSESERDALCQ